MDAHELTELIDFLGHRFALPAIPADPFAADGGSMKYVRSMQIDGVETAVIYSVAENKKDDAASTQPASSRRIGSPATVFDSPYDRDDLVFSRDRPDDDAGRTFRLMDHATC